MSVLTFPYGHFIVPQIDTRVQTSDVACTNIINRLSHLPIEGDLFLPFFVAAENNVGNCGENAIEFAIFRKKFSAASQLVIYDYEKILSFADKFSGYTEKCRGVSFPTLIENFYYSIASADFGKNRAARLRRLEHLINLSVFPETEKLPVLDQHKQVFRDLYEEKKSAQCLADLFSYIEKVESLLNSFTWKTQF